MNMNFLVLAIALILPVEIKIDRPSVDTVAATAIKCTQTCFGVTGDLAVKIDLGNPGMKPFLVLRPYPKDIEVNKWYVEFDLLVVYDETVRQTQYITQTWADSGFGLTPKPKGIRVYFVDDVLEIPVDFDDPTFKRDRMYRPIKMTKLKERAK